MWTSLRRSIHPATGAIILGLDWLLFSGNVLSLGASTLVLSVLGFGLGSAGTAYIQRRYAGDSRLLSTFKGTLAGITVGIPLPVAGTAAGGLILTVSGLDRLWSVPSREDSTGHDASEDGM